MLRSIPGELRPAANPEGSVSTRILRIAEVFALDWMERDDYEHFEPYQDVLELFSEDFDTYLYLYVHSDRLELSRIGSGIE